MANKFKYNPTGSEYTGSWIGEMALVQAWNRARSHAEILEVMEQTQPA